MGHEWFPDWSRDVCAIVASGSSASQEQVDRLKERCRVLVVNNGYQLAPWADALYAADARWWDKYRGALGFPGLKITQDLPAARSLGLQHVVVMDGESPLAHAICVHPKGLIGNGGNGGFQAINLAVQFGSRKHLWVGFDFDGLHWHDKHPEPLKNPRAHTLEKWRVRLDAQAECFGDLGVEVINVSAISALRGYPKMSLDDALKNFGV